MLRISALILSVFQEDIRKKSERNRKSLLAKNHTHSVDLETNKHIILITLAIKPEGGTQF